MTRITFDNLNGGESIDADGTPQSSREAHEHYQPQIDDGIREINRLTRELADTQAALATMHRLFDEKDKALATLGSQPPHKSDNAPSAELVNTLENIRAAALVMDGERAGHIAGFAFHALKLVRAKKSPPDSGTDSARLDWLSRCWPNMNIDCWLTSTGTVEMRHDNGAGAEMIEGEDLRDVLDAVMRRYPGNERRHSVCACADACTNPALQNGPECKMRLGTMKPPHKTNPSGEHGYPEGTMNDTTKGE